MDLRQRSKVVENTGDFKLTRAYYDPDCDYAQKTINDVVEQEIRK